MQKKWIYTDKTIIANIHIWDWKWEDRAVTVWKISWYNGQWIPVYDLIYNWVKTGELQQTFIKEKTKK